MQGLRGAILDNQLISATIPHIPAYTKTLIRSNYELTKPDAALIDVVKRQSATVVA